MLISATLAQVWLLLQSKAKGAAFSALDIFNSVSLLNITTFFALKIDRMSFFFTTYSLTTSWLLCCWKKVHRSTIKNYEEVFFVPFNYFQV